ncbi:MAG: bacteriocin-protection protein, partial [Pseudomonadota bacterium]
MDSPTLTFADQQAWEVWLEANGGTASGVWLRIAKRSAGEATVSYAQAIESALCHGWIDGQKQAESEHYWLQRFTPRTAKSIWSRINKERAEALIAAG